MSIRPLGLVIIFIHVFITTTYCKYVALPPVYTTIIHNVRMNRAYVLGESLLMFALLIIAYNWAVLLQYIMELFWNPGSHFANYYFYVHSNDRQQTA